MIRKHKTTQKAVRRCSEAFQKYFIKDYRYNKTEDGAEAVFTM